MLSLWVTPSRAACPPKAMARIEAAYTHARIGQLSQAHRAIDEAYFQLENGHPDDKCRTRFLAKLEATTALLQDWIEKIQRGEALLVP